MRADCMRVCGSCRACAAERKRFVAQAPLRPCAKPLFPCEGWSIDLITDLPPFSLGHRYILVVVCCFSKWVELIPLYTKESSEVAEALYRCILACFGKPQWFRARRWEGFRGLDTLA